jgi:hypothetical protein
MDTINTRDYSSSSSRDASNIQQGRQQQQQDQIFRLCQRTWLMEEQIVSPNKLLAHSAHTLKFLLKNAM